MKRTDYLPRWRALLLARVRLGEEAKLWRDGPRYCAGVVVRRILPGRMEVRVCGEGATWREAVNNVALGWSKVTYRGKAGRRCHTGDFASASLQNLIPAYAT